MSESIYGEYITLTRKYKKLYGEKTIVLLQVGAFFEVYGFRDSKGDVQESEICEFSRICNLNISEKKAEYMEKQVLMAGFRDYTLDRYLEKLTSSSYTAVVYVQEKVDNNKPVRKLDSVHSAGTYMSYDTESEEKITNNIACIWIDIHKPILQTKGFINNVSKTRETMICGVAIANIFTGTSYISEFQQPLSIQPSTFDELERIISTHSPSEIIFISPFVQEEIQSILQFSGTHSNSIHYIDSSSSEKVEKCTQQKYISHILGTFYGEDAHNTCVEFNLYPTATQSFCFLLDFVQEHNPNLVKNISIPIFHTNSEVLLANHTLKQLNILDDVSLNSTQHGHLSSVNSFLNKCCTSMGRRQFFTQLVNPTTNEEWLDTEYKMTETILSENLSEFIPKFRKLFSQIKDIERICRQIVLRKIYPSSLFYLYQSIGFISSIYEDIYQYDSIQQYLHPSSNNINDIFIEIRKFLDNHLFIDKCKNISSINTFDECIIKPGVSNDLDNLLHSLETNNYLFSYIHETLNDCVRKQDKKIDNNVEYVKIHNTEKSGATLQITKKRGLLLKTFVQEHKEEEIPKLMGTKWGDIKLSSASGNADEIEFPFLTKVCRDILHQKEYMNKLIAKSYQDILEMVETEHYEKLEVIANYIAKFDVLINKAYIAKEYKYCKPTIENNSEKSFVNIKALRHVLIEHIQTKEIYVANDIELGNKQNGVLLYGTNAVGKTSFIRALGISIVMAQAGLYVPCASFHYKPYQAIFSRILGNDNLFKGLSTFAVEMSELRVILKLSNENSLILGDELCSGTETESALSIFVSGLIDMHKKNSSFIFATHFHEIINYEEIQNLHKLSLKHMSVRYDRALDALIYDRKLTDGPGNRMYGLEVCKSLYLPEEFLEQAYSIRTKYFPESKGELSHSISKYNASKIKGICELCKNDLGNEIHHLHQQKDADDDGFIVQDDGGVVHKNHPANLMSVCEECHDNYHANEENMTLIRKKTSKGYKIEGL